MDVTSHDDPESTDAGSLDLTPRSAGERRAPRAGAKRLMPWAIGVMVLAAIGVVGTGLSGSTTYFYNVDDAIAQRSEIGDRRVRLQGNVTEGSVVQRADGLRFTLRYGGESVPVRLTGDVPDLFGPSIPVVIEGHFAGDYFASDRALVKHDETYDEDNSDRIREAERDADKAVAPSTTAAP